jgi:hypothetical protein
MNEMFATLDLERLELALRRDGLLDGATVRDLVIVSARTTVLSRIVRLRAEYAGKTQRAPERFVLKTGHPDRLETGWKAARQEITFYREIASATSGRFTPRCFDAFADADTKAWHLLLEDLSQTHEVPGAWPLPLPLAECERIVSAHARRQASCWDGPIIDRFAPTARWYDGVAVKAYQERLRAQVAKFADRLGDSLPSERRDLFVRLIEATPRLFARYDTRHDLTIVQGDAHVWNCFLPNDGGADVRFFDWDSWRVDVGASDLAYLMAVHWYPDRRHRFEKHLLDHYHAALLAAGVRGYERASLDADYRFATLWMVTWPVWQEAFGVPPVYWWNNLERVWLAIDDLGCRDLL